MFTFETSSGCRAKNYSITGGVMYLHHYSHASKPAHAYLIYVRGLGSKEEIEEIFFLKKLCEMNYCLVIHVSNYASCELLHILLLSISYFVVFKQDMQLHCSYLIYFIISETVFKLNLLMEI